MRQEELETRSLCAVSRSGIYIESIMVKSIPIRNSFGRQRADRPSQNRPRRARVLHPLLHYMSGGSKSRQVPETVSCAAKRSSSRRIYFESGSIFSLIGQQCICRSNACAVRGYFRKRHERERARRSSKSPSDYRGTGSRGIFPLFCRGRGRPVEAKRMGEKLPGRFCGSGCRRPEKEDRAPH